MTWGSAKRKTEIPGERSNLAKQLAVVQQDVNELERTKNALRVSIAGVTAERERVGNNIIGTANDDLSRAAIQAQYRATNELAELGAQLNSVEDELALKRSQRDAILEQVKQHPIYAAAITRQRELIAKVVELSRKSRRVPVGEIQGVREQIIALEYEEQDFVHDVNFKLRAEGLPDITPTTERRRFYAHTTG